MSRKAPNPPPPKGVRPPPPPPPPPPRDVRGIQEDYNLFKKIKDFFKTSPDKCVHPFGLPYTPCEVCKPKVGTVSSGFPMPKFKPPKLMSDYLIPEGWKFEQCDPKYLDRIEEIFKHIEEGDITAPSNYQLLEYQIELIQEVLDERNKK